MPPTIPDNEWLHVDPVNQYLRLRCGPEILARWPITTGANGLGEENGSGRTPRGWHVVRARIGDGLPANTVFVGRRDTGERYTSVLAAAAPERDWILGRILWLSGLEVGHNRLGTRDTMRRFIYIHGMPPERVLGHPSSHGCICMHPEAVVELFERVPVGMRVLIGE